MGCAAAAPALVRSQLAECPGLGKQLRHVAPASMQLVSDGLRSPVAAAWVAHRFAVGLDRLSTGLCSVLSALLLGDPRPLNIPSETEGSGRDLCEQQRVVTQ